MADELAGRLYFELLPDVDRKKFQAALKASLAGADATVETGLKLKAGAAKKVVADAKSAMRDRKDIPTLHVNLALHVSATKNVHAEAKKKLAARKTLPKLYVDLAIKKGAIKDVATQAGVVGKTASQAADIKVSATLAPGTDEKLLAQAQVAVASAETALKVTPLDVPVSLDEKAWKRIAEAGEKEAIKQQKKLEGILRGADDLRKKRTKDTVASIVSVAKAESIVLDDIANKARRLRTATIQGEADDLDALGSVTANKRYANIMGEYEAIKEATEIAGAKHRQNIIAEHDELERVTDILHAKRVRSLLADFEQVEAITAIANAKLTGKIETEYEMREELAETAAARKMALDRATHAMSEQLAEIHADRISAITKKNYENIDMLSEIHRRKRMAGIAADAGMTSELESIASARRAGNIIGEFEQLPALTAVDAAKMQTRINAEVANGLDKRSLLELKHVNAMKLLHERAEMAKRKVSGQTLRTLRNDLSQFDSSTTRILRNLTHGYGLFTAGVIASFAAISAAAIVQFGKIEEASNKAASLYTAQQLGGSGLTGDAFQGRLLSLNRGITEQITSEARAVAVATKFNTEEIAEGFRYLAGAGVELQSSISSIDTVARLAQAGFMELEDTSDLLVQGFIAAGGDITQFGKEVDGLADKLVFVANESAVTMEEVMKAFSNRAGASFKAVGQDADEALNVIRLFGQTGIKGLKAGEQSAILIREITRSAALKAPDAWKKYGIELKNADGSVRSFAQVLDDLSRVTAKQTNNFKDPAALVKLFNEELKLTEKSSGGLRQLLPSIAELQRRGSGAYEELNRLQRESAGRLAAQTQAVTDTLSFQFEAFTNNISNVASLFASGAGRSITQFLKDINGEAGKGTSLFSTLSDEAEAFGKRFGTFVAGALVRLKGPEGEQFFGGIVDLFEGTLAGVAGLFTAFRDEVFGGGSKQGFFAVMGQAMSGLGEFSRNTLPGIGATLGEIVAYIRDNEDQVRSLLKAWALMFFASKALRLVIIPLVGAFQKLVGAVKWIAGKKAAAGVSGLGATMRLLLKSVLRLAGPIGLVVAGFEFLIGAVKGFHEGFTEQLNSSKEGREALAGIADAVEALRKAIAKMIPVLLEALGFIGRLGESIGKFFGRILGQGVTSMAQLIASFDALRDGRIIDSFKLIGEAFTNSLIAPMKLAVAWLYDTVADAISRMGSIPGLEGMAKDAEKELRKAADAAADFKLDLKTLDDRANKFKGSVTKNVIPTIKTMRDEVVQASREYRNLARSIDRTTTATIFQTTVRAAEKSTQAQIDLYQSLIGKSDEAKRKRSLLGISEVEAQKKLFAAQAGQMDALAAGPMAEFGRKMNALGNPVKVTPEMNTEALQTIDATILAFQQEKRDIMALNLPKNQKDILIRQLDDAIKYTRAFAKKNPVQINFVAGGQEFEGFRGKEDATKRLMATYRKVVDSPLLIKRLSDSNRALFEKADAQARAAGGGKDLVLGNIFAELEKGHTVKRGGRTATKAMFSLGKDIARGISTGAKAGSPEVLEAALNNANAYMTGLNQVFRFGSPSKETKKQGKWAAQGLRDGIASETPKAVLAAAAAGALIVSSFALGARGAGLLVRLAARRVMSNLREDLRGSREEFVAIGAGVMLGFLSGMRSVYTTGVQPFILTIAQWIKDNKGPISYDQTLLRPAGEAMMSGFKRGLSDGFEEVKGWVKQVGPDLAKHTIPDSVFKEMSAEFLIGNAKADLDFDPQDFFADIAPLAGTLGFGVGGIGQSTGIEDTINQAKIIGKMFGITPNILSEMRRYNNPAYNAAIGGAPNSLHVQGLAMDYGLGGGNSFGELSSAAAWANQYLGKAFNEVLWQTTGHYDHLHLGWIQGTEKLLADIAGASQQVEEALAFAAGQTGVDFNLLAAIAKAESGFNPTAGSPAGAQGLMQLMPATAGSLGVTNLFDPKQNALGGAKYIKQMLDTFNGSLPLALAGYNAGPGNASIAMTSFGETIAYIERVMRYFQQFSTGNYRAQGGKVNASTPYVVGERGQELFIPSTNGSVVSNRDLRNLISALQSSPASPTAPVVNDNRVVNVSSNSSDSATVAALVDSRMRSQVVGVRR